jgi:hypothetical protein
MLYLPRPFARFSQLPGRIYFGVGEHEWRSGREVFRVGRFNGGG